MSRSSNVIARGNAGEVVLHIVPILSVKSRFVNHLEATLGKLTPQEIDPFTVMRLKKSIDQNHTPGSTRNVLELLRRIINFGVKNNLCSPLDFLIELPKVESERIEVLTDEQFKSLTETCLLYTSPSPRD